MSDSGFTKGQLIYTVASITPAELAAKTDGIWKDGYVAFANSEKRLSQLPNSMDADFFSQRVQAVPGAEGYVTEINLWRKNGSVIEEIAVERDENRFYLQHWLLETSPKNGTGNCWYKAAKTEAGSHHNKGRRLFNGSLKSIEVVWPEKRLNFYLTVEGL
jgi:hypothetical protein